MSRMFVYLWEYRVRPDAVEAFEAAYGPDGGWVELFRGHPGYLGTRLLRDADDRLRYVTVDTWRSRADHARFREASREAFERLDRECEALTEEERRLGDFEEEWRTGGTGEGA